MQCAVHLVLWVRGDCALSTDLSVRSTRDREIMNIREKVRGAMRRVGEVSLREWLSTNLFAGRDGRRTAGAGSNLAPFSSPGFARAGIPGTGSRAGAPAPHTLVPKPTPANLRRFAETPVARRAINVIKDRIVGMRWRIQPRRGRVLEQIPDGAQRIQVLTENFEAPNPDDSFRSLVGAGTGGCDRWGIWGDRT